MFDPMHPNPPEWARTIASGLHALKAGAGRSRAAWEQTHAASDALQADADACNPDTGTVPNTALHAVTVLQDGTVARHPYSETLAGIAVAYLGLEGALTHVWHRAARSYAYATTCLLADLTAYGDDAPKAGIRLTASTVLAVPSPIGDDHELHDAHRAAHVAQQPLMPINPFPGPDLWAYSAQAWHDLADLTERRIWCRLTESAPAAPAGR
ncbi:hypothetical protein [Streptomyces sp. NPDC017940]|uniref:hypothetical protein n=1 Tax=Streptomyces sp. NPDC017940 TaxID=3365017 RepID=UPI0037A80C93